jgi:hypothetical protein
MLRLAWFLSHGISSLLKVEDIRGINVNGKRHAVFKDNLDFWAKEVR